MAKRRKTRKKQEVGYFDFDTPTQETLINAGKTALVIGVGLMLAKAGMEVVPTAYSKYAKIGVATVGLGVAAAAKDSTVKLVSSGIAALQFTGFISEVAKKNLELKEDTTINRVLKAGLGMNGASDGLAAADQYVSISDWQPETIDLQPTQQYAINDIVYG